MKFQGFVGGSYQLDSVNIDDQRCVNMYPEIIESGTGKGAQVAYLKRTAGTEKIFTCGEGPIRLVYVPEYKSPLLNLEVMVVSGNKLFVWEYINNDWVLHTTEAIYGYPFAELKTTTGQVSAASIIISQSDNNIYGQVVVTDGANCYVYTRSVDTSVGTNNRYFITFVSEGYADVTSATQALNIDNYVIFIKKFSNQYFVSDINSFAVNPLSFGSAEGNPDYIIAEASLNRDLWLFGEKTIEISSNTGNANFPFERVQGGFIEVGILSQFSLSKIDGRLLWLGRSEDGQGIVYMANSPNFQRISTHAVEQAISRYANPELATSYAYQKNGHNFYVLNFAEATWVYDLSTGLWHERAYNKNGLLTRHRGDNYAFVAPLGLHLIGDYEKGFVYSLTDSRVTDYNAYIDSNGLDQFNEITRLRRFPHVSGSLKNIFFNSLQIDMQMGLGVDGIQSASNATPEPLAVNPQAMLRWSSDGGHTWSSELYVSLGLTGQYKARAMFDRLGMSRDRVFEFKITDPCAVTLIDAEIDFQIGRS
jgi:hypothetical protein